MATCSRRPFGACALGLLLALAAPARAEDPAPPAWDAAGPLQHALDAAVAGVEEVCGARFEARPVVRRSTWRDVRDVLAQELGDALAAQGPALESALANLSQGMFAKYAPDEHVVHVMPENATRVAGLLKDPALAGEDVLRVVLAHEVAHALDFQRYPELDRRRRELASRPEAARAVSAVIEGHAQWVAQRVASRWGLDAAFERFTRSITALPEGLDPTQALILRTQVAEFAFAYGKGHQFCEAVDRAQGRAGLERALAEPPLTPEEIEQPERWLDPSRAPARADLGTHLAAMAGVAAGDGWQKGENAILRAHLEAQLSVLPQASRTDALAGFVNGVAGVWQRDEPTGYVAAGVMRFDGPERARAWIATSRELSRAKDAQLTQGEVRILASTYADVPGVDPALGFRCTKRLTLPGLGEKDYVSLWLAVGATAFEVTVFEPDAAQRKALDALPADLAKIP